MVTLNFRKKKREKSGQNFKKSIFGWEKATEKKFQKKFENIQK